MKEKQPLLSIIVPVYNTEKYLKRCLDKVITQKYQNFELIIINDGSTDNSANIINEFSKNYKEKVTVINNENSGQGISRNIGLDMAKGEYIAFLDSDDTIYYDTYYKMISKALKSDYDIVVCDVNFIDEKGNTIVQKSIKDSEKYSVSNNIKYGCNFASPCNKIFKKSIWKNYRFPKMYYEDSAIIPVILSNFDHVGYIEEPLYNYYFRKNSTSADKNNIRTLDMLKAYKMSIESINIKYKEDLIFAYTCYILEFLSNKNYKLYNHFIEFVRENRNIFEQNKLIKDDFKLKKILDYCKTEEEKQLEKNINYKFKFSIIMAVYNVEPFINEAIDSIIEQDIGFEENVQLILVDDGTPDNSGKICEEYKEKYPNNIIVIHKENGGVSSARNAGIPYAKGKYVNFMDPDDKLSLNSLSLVYIFFEINYDEVDLVTIPFVIFDGATGEHPSNQNKFSKGSRVINLNTEYKCIQMSMSISFIKSKLLKYIEFDTSLSIAEDAKEVHKILLIKQKLGVVSEARYYYRKRSFGCKSAIDIANYKKENYNTVLKNFILWTINNAIKKLGELPNYLQFTIMCDLKWRFKIDFIHKDVLTFEEEKEFKNLISVILQYIDDKYIWEQNIEHFYKVYILNIKYGRYAYFKKINNDVQLFHNSRAISLLSNIDTVIEFIKYDNNILTVQGYTICLNCSDDEDIPVFAQINDRITICNNINRYSSRYSLGDVVYRHIGFELNIEVKSEVELYKIKFYYIYRGCKIARNRIKFGRYSPIGTELKNSYFYKNKRVLTYANSTLFFKKCGKKGRILHEYNFIKEVNQLNKGENKENIKLRLACLIKKLFTKKPIWLISDKANRADDNGEAFFKYLNNNKNIHVNNYFVIDKKCKDKKRLRKIGKTVNFLSFKHKLLFLLCTNNISAYQHYKMLNPLHDKFYMFRDLVNDIDFVFLQHGIIHSDISKSLNKYSRNIRLFITSTKREYNSILNTNYCYDKDEVVLTGLPRYDLLYNDNKKIITFAPTWRQGLFEKFNPDKEIWEISENFNISEYLHFYSNLINNEILLSKAEKYGYKICFVPHPTFFPYINLFNISNKVTINGTSNTYRKMFAESSLIITDYSSIAFDFAFLRKPIIYTQFDKEDFFDGKGHVTGYFDYEKDGFGEVEYDLESTINRIIEYMENDCKLKDKYRKRIDDFFEFNDKNNCERIYQAIINKDNLK